MSFTLSTLQPSAPCTVTDIVTLACVDNAIQRVVVSNKLFCKLPIDKQRGINPVVSSRGLHLFMQFAVDSHGSLSHSPCLSKVAFLLMEATHASLDLVLDGLNDAGVSTLAQSLGSFEILQSHLHLLLFKCHHGILWSENGKISFKKKSQRQKQNNVLETDRFKPVNYTEKDRRLCEMNVVVFGLKMIEDFSLCLLMSTVALRVHATY